MNLPFPTAWGVTLSSLDVLDVTETAVMCGLDVCELVITALGCA